MTIIRKADEIAAEVNQTIKDELKSSEHRLNSNS
jgi:hypothetical protein